MKSRKRKRIRMGWGTLNDDREWRYFSPPRRCLLSSCEISSPEVRKKIAEKVEIECEESSRKIE